MIAYSPIVHAELKHHAHGIPRRRRWRRWLNNLFPVLAILIALEVIALILFTAITGVDLAQVSPQIAGVLLYLLPAFVLLPVTLTLYVGIWLRTLTLASQSIVREKQNGTWDLLLLTGISRRRLLIGKWWAVLRSMWRQYTLLFVMRIALILFAIFETSHFTLTRNAAEWFTRPYSYDQIPQLPEILLAMGLMALMTVFSAGFTAAIGVLASLLLRRTALTMALSLLIGVLLPLLVAGSIAVGSALWLATRGAAASFVGTPQWVSASMMAYGGFSLLDSGTVVGSQLVIDAENKVTTYRWMGNGPTPHLEYYPYTLYLASALMTLTLYGLLSYLLLRVAELIARRQGVLPPKGV